MDAEKEDAKTDGRPERNHMDPAERAHLDALPLDLIKAARSATQNGNADAAQTFFTMYRELRDFLQHGGEPG